MSGLAKLLAFLQLGIGTYQTVRQMETVHPEAKSGPTKLDLVVNTIGVASQAVPEIAQHVTKKDAEGFAANLTPLIVGVLNTSGVFKK